MSDDYLQLLDENVDSNQENSSSDSENGNCVTDTGGQFDTNLPTTHKYLGKLNNVSGYTLFDDGEILTLVAIHTNTLVFPGFTLPLLMHHELEKSVMQNHITKKTIFVLVCADESGSRLFKYGVTMEVFEAYMKHSVLYIKARGRQRCKIVPGQEVRHLAGRLQQITVQIMAEPDVTSPIADTQCLTLKLRRGCSTENYGIVTKNYKYRRYHLSQYAHPSWVYDHNEVSYYAKLMLDNLGMFYLKENIPKNPVALSYWFVQNFQLTHEERLRLMKLNSTLERLRLEMRFLKMQRLICCGTCKLDIADQADVFAMSKDGVQSNYCNPGGHVYETVTVSNARNFGLVGSPSKQFSWFPGYLWTIMQCRLCKGHIGWKFSSTKLQPPEFFGLARSGLNVQIFPQDDE